MTHFASFTVMIYSKKISLLSLFLVAILFHGCNQDYKKEELTRAEKVIDESIIASGVTKLDSATISFSFRDKNYKAVRKNGLFSLERSFTDSTGNYRDVYDNNGFKRFLNGEELTVVDSMAEKYKESINSVHYFSILPYGLRDKAVNSEFLGEVKINGKDYNKIKITFDKDGGGSDFEDIFIYWFNQQSKLPDFLAYQFNVNGGGMRFREAYNERQIKGVRIVDYNNFKPKSDTLSLRNLDKQFEMDNLELLSKIELKNVKVN